jgi:hypothetical protein
MGVGVGVNPLIPTWPVNDCMLPRMEKAGGTYFAGRVELESSEDGMISNFGSGIVPGWVDAVNIRIP